MRNVGSKLFVFLVLAAIVGGLGYAFFPEPAEVDLGTIERGTVRVTVDEDGKTRIHEKYVVSAPLVGRLLRINMDAGDPVIASKTLLATIEPRDPDLLDARAVAQAEARVKGAEASLKKIEPELEMVRAAQAYAEAEVTRARKASSGDAISRAELENAEMLFRQKSEELRSTRIAEDIARFELEQAEAALLRTRPHADEMPLPAVSTAAANPSSDDLAPADPVPPEPTDGGKFTSNGNGGWNFTIFSPITGRVLRVLQESAAVVSAGTPLVELGDPADLEAVIEVLSRDAVKIHPGAQVFLEHWGGVKPLNGRVRVVEPSGFTKISTLGVEEQRVNVIVDLTDPPEARTTLGDCFRVEARIVIDEAKDVLKVPTSALYRVGERSAVFRVVDHKAHQQLVTLGRQNGLEAEVVEGLAEGDQVVLHPSDQVEDGKSVRQR
ncbi:MAG TPA: HlyD family efflux transporter periplasmic adaptor subunit [Lacipirellulaceae bacterium]|jgi:HlyD family secretion protein